MSQPGGGRSHRDLIVWQKAMDLVDQVYRICRALPKEELFGLRAQLTRAVVSVPCNLAEGHGRMSRREFVQFARIARGSISEVRTLLEILVRNQLVRVDAARDSERLADEVARMTSSLIKSLKSQANDGP